MGQSNSKEQFEEYALRHMDFVYTEALRLTGNLPDAERLVQATYLHAYDIFDGVGKELKTCRWILSILRKVFHEVPVRA